MLKYGIDKPDLRNPIVIADVTEEFDREDVTFNAFKNVIKAGGVVRAIPAPGAGVAAAFLVRQAERLGPQRDGRRGLGYIVLEEDGGSRRQGTDRQIPSPEVLSAHRRRDRHQGRATPCSSPPTSRQRAATLAGAARIGIGDELGLITQGPLRVLLDRRLPDVRVERGGEEDRLLAQPVLHAELPIDEFLALDPTDEATILGIKAIQYDIVCNGIELSSGAIRNHRPDVMLKAFEIAGYGERGAGEEVRRHAARVAATARRRTAASRPASTASSCCSPARRTCAKSCCSR